jgi:LysR family transcriptional regulator, glycine cleavage system transcriptional activator
MRSTDELPPLTALRAFHAAGTHGSFQEAARALAVTPSAVSHQIRGLEEWLGAPLFVRGARRIELTKAGRALLRESDLAFARIAAASKRLRGTGGRKLRVSALPLITGAWLIPRLQDFETKHPGIALEIETTNRIADLDRDGVDVAIRNLRAPTPGLVARKLLDVTGVPVCSPKLLKGGAALSSPRDLALHTLIHVSARPDAWDTWLKAAGAGGLKGKRDLSFDTVPAALDAAARGHGVALGMHPLVWEAPVAKDLVVPFALKVDSASSYYVVHRKADGGRAEVKAFVDWIVKEMAAFRAKHRAAPKPFPARGVD